MRTPVNIPRLCELNHHQMCGALTYTVRIKGGKDGGGAHMRSTRRIRSILRKDKLKS